MRTNRAHRPKHKEKTKMDLGSIASKAVSDVETFHQADAAVEKTKAELSTEQATRLDAAVTAQGSLQALISAATSELAGLPAVEQAPAPVV